MSRTRSWEARLQTRSFLTNGTGYTSFAFPSWIPSTGERGLWGSWLPGGGLHAAWTHFPPSPRPEVHPNPPESPDRPQEERCFKFWMTSVLS